MITNIKNIKKIKFNIFQESNGELVPIEEINDIPFKVKRIYYISNNHKKDIRGNHAHKKCKQVIVCIKGECKIICDNGKKKKIITLNKSNIGVYIPPMIWSRQQFTKSNSILLVIANIRFNENDYIRDYSQFKKLI